MPTAVQVLHFKIPKYTKPLPKPRASSGRGRWSKGNLNPAAAPPSRPVQGATFQAREKKKRAVLQAPSPPVTQYQSEMGWRDIGWQRTQRLLPSCVHKHAHIHIVPLPHPFSDSGRVASCFTGGSFLTVVPPVLCLSEFYSRYFLFPKPEVSGIRTLLDLHALKLWSFPLSESNTCARESERGSGPALQWGAGGQRRD